MVALEEAAMVGEAMSNPWAGKRVMITGVCGTVGGELLRQISAVEPEEILGIDNNESELFFLRNEYAEHRNYHFYLCDVRDRDRLMARCWRRHGSGMCWLRRGR